MAYELGKHGGSFPDHLNPEAADLLLGISGVHLIRPTIPAPVIVMDGSARTMSWGFRRSFAPMEKGCPPVMRTIVDSRNLPEVAGSINPGTESAAAERICRGNRITEEKVAHNRPLLRRVE